MKIITASMRAALLIAAAVFGLTAAASAGPTTYTYSGPNFTFCNGPWSPDCPSANVSGSLTTSLSGSELDNLGDAFNQVDISNTVTAFSFSNGLGDVLTENNVNLAQFAVRTDSSGNVLNWVVGMYVRSVGSDGNFNGYERYIESLNREIDTQFTTFQISDDTFRCLDLSTRFGCTGGEIANAGNDVGFWSMQSSDVPEPLTVSLFAAGLAGISALRRRKGRRA